MAAAYRAMVEIWQANAAGRYRHSRDNHPAPLDPNFLGAGRFSPTAKAIIASSPSSQRLSVAQPPQRLASAHIHFSLFRSLLVTRLVTQMYFRTIL